MHAIHMHALWAIALSACVRSLFSRHALPTLGPLEVVTTMSAREEKCERVENLANHRLISDGRRRRRAAPCSFSMSHSKQII